MKVNVIVLEADESRVHDIHTLSDTEDSVKDVQHRLTCELDEAHEILENNNGCWVSCSGIKYCYVPKLFLQDESGTLYEYDECGDWKKLSNKEANNFYKLVGRLLCKQGCKV